MKKVGIITIHKICNYGSVLQAYALQTAISNLGYDCYIIDYDYPNEYHLNQMKIHSNTYANHNYSLKERIINKIFSYINKKQDQNYINDKFKSFRDNYLQLTTTYHTQESIKNCSEFDIYVSGSDQIWNPRYCFADTTFFLSWTNRIKISYASSLGVKNINDNYKKILYEHLIQYKAISVREKSGINILSSLGLSNVKLVCDPTLLIKKNEWERFINTPIIKKEYILFYILTYTFDPYPYAEKLIQYIKSKTKKKIIIIGGRNIDKIMFDRRVLTNIGPIEFLNIVYYSDLIVTTSFHGTAFAVNFNKPVYSIVDSNDKDERIQSLLKCINLENRIIRIGDRFPNSNDFFCSGNYDLELNKYRTESIDYLKKALLL